jgi:hypothetical protein
MGSRSYEAVDIASRARELELLAQHERVARAKVSEAAEELKLACGAFESDETAAEMGVSLQDVRRQYQRLVTTIEAFAVASAERAKGV